MTLSELTQQQIFTKPTEYYEARRICFDAEAGYNQLLFTSINMHEGNTSLRLFDDQEEARYGIFNCQRLLVKNPSASETSLVGVRNALGLDFEGDLALFYSKDGVNWKWGRKAKVEDGVGDSGQEVLEWREIPGIEFLFGDIDSTSDSRTLYEALQAFNLHNRCIVDIATDEDVLRYIDSRLNGCDAKYAQILLDAVADHLLNF